MTTMRPYRKARGRRPTAAQIAAAAKAWDAREGTIEGRYHRGQIIVDADGDYWRVTRPGRRYHEDVSDLMYPVVRVRAPRAARAWRDLETIAETIYGRHDDAVLVAGGALHIRLRAPGLLAGGDDLAVDGDIVSAYHARYDDAPRTGQVRDAKLAARVRELIALRPTWTPMGRVHARPQTPVGKRGEQQ